MEPKGKILPVYFVADQSGSMVSCIGELNKGLADLLADLQVQVFAASKVRFNLIGFANEAARHLENCDLTELDSMPELAAGGLTAYGAAFSLLADVIPTDVAALKQQGYAVHRPAVFFLTDGAPCGEPQGYWEQQYQRLMGIREHPNIIAFGIGEAESDTIRQVATQPQFALLQKPGADTGAALANFMQALTQSVVNSGTAVGTGSSELRIEKPDDFISLGVDEV